MDGAHEDALMPRTAARPIPKPRLISSQFALSFGIFLSLLGLGILWAGTNEWSVGLTFLTLVIYLAFYTPLKKKSSLAIEVGSRLGAPPPSSDG